VVMLEDLAAHFKIKTQVGFAVVVSVVQLKKTTVFWQKHSIPMALDVWWISNENVVPVKITIN